MSRRTTPDSRSASSRQASADASGSSTILETLTPLSSTARRRFWMLETAPLTTCARMVTSGGEACGILDALGPIEDVAPRDDVYHPLVLVQVELAGLLFEPADEPVCDRQVPAAVQERDFCVERRDVATRDADGHPTTANAAGFHGFSDRIGGGFAVYHDPPLEAVARGLPHG